LDGISYTVEIVSKTSTFFEICVSYPSYDLGQPEPLVYVLLDQLVISLVVKAMMILFFNIILILINRIKIILKKHQQAPDIYIPPTQNRAGINLLSM
jgi:hypothetical protein